MRRFRKLFLCLASVALLAAACGDDDDTAATSGGDTDQTAGEGVELSAMVFSSSPAEDEALQALIDKYNAQSDNTANLNIVPEYDTTLQAALAGGEPPDLFYVDSNRLPDLVEAGVLASAEGQIEGVDDFYPSLKQAFTYNDTFWGPPKDFSTLALEYNVDMFEAAGLEPPTTWEELATTAQTLTADGVVGLALAPEYPRWGAFMRAAGGAVTNEDFTEMTVDSEEVRTAMEYLGELHASGAAATATELDAGWSGEAFGQQKAAMTVEGNWIVGAMRNDFPDLNYAVVELPEGPAGKGTLAFTVGWGVAANAPNPEASWDLIDFLVSPENQLEYTKQFPVMPSRESIAADWVAANPELEPFLNGAEYAYPFQFSPGFQAVLDTLNDGIQGITAGNREIDEVITATNDAGEPILGG